MSFTRKKEDFICEKCGTEVKGDGYTNHCPKCLWSKHVDVHPGDRAAECGGMMKPSKVIFQKGEWIITHECIKCGAKKNNKTVPTDDFDVLVALSKTLASSR
jgi:hypothetical protein